MNRRELVRAVGAGTITTLGGCTAFESDPVSVESVQSTVAGEAGRTVLTVIELQLSDSVDSHTTTVEMKIEREGQQVAYGSIVETIFTNRETSHVSFPVTEIDASLPIRPDECDAFGRLEGGDWIEATYVDSIKYD